MTLAFPCIHVLRSEPCSYCHGIRGRVVLFPFLCAISCIVFIIIMHLSQISQNRHLTLQRGTAKKLDMAMEYLRNLSQSKRIGASIGFEDISIAKLEIEESKENGLLSWLLSSDGVDSTRINQTDLMEAKKKFLEWAPDMKYSDGVRYLKNHPNLVDLYNERLISENGEVKYTQGLNGGLNMIKRILSADKGTQVKDHVSNKFSKIAELRNLLYSVTNGGSRDKGLRPELTKTKHRPILSSSIEVERPKPKQNNSPKRYQKPVVPKVVHQIWFKPFGNVSCYFRFHNFISILSIHKFIQPDVIYIWHNSTPCGYWWHQANQIIPNIVMKELNPPRFIYGQPITIVEHQSDVARIKTLLKYGGIYMDTDVIAVKSWDPLLHYETTMGTENPTLLCNGVVIAVPKSRFLSLWLDSYKVYNSTIWAYNSGMVSTKIARKYPHLLHVEWDTIHRPSWNEIDWLYEEGKLWDWSINYGIHLWYRWHGFEHSPDDIRKLNTTMAEVMRYVFYGSTDMK